MPAYFISVELNLPCITEANCQDFALRVRFHDALFGALLCPPRG